MIKSLIAFPYEMARRPVVAIDNGLSSRLPETSTARVALDRAIGSADKLAGALLGNSEIAQRGAERLDRSEKLVAAARLEQEAAARREQADEKAASGRQEAAEKRETAEKRAASGLEEADEAEERGKQEAEERARKAAATKKAAADQKAASRKRQAEARKAGVDSVATAKKKAAQREAKSEVAKARENEAAAGEARADAERLSVLTETKKNERKQD
jgi:hypothetical protein